MSDEKLTIENSMNFCLSVLEKVKTAPYEIIFDCLVTLALRIVEDHAVEGLNQEALELVAIHTIESVLDDRLGLADRILQLDEKEPEEPVTVN